jgi:hypothetical protein
MTRTEIQLVLEVNYFYDGDAKAIARWMATPLRQFRGKTAKMLLKAGRGLEVIGYVQSAILEHKADMKKSDAEQLEFDQKQEADNG